jgi:hypothetical protein
VWWHTKLKSKAIPIQAWSRPLGLHKAEAPRNSRYSAYEDGKIVSPMSGYLYCPEGTWYLILVEVELTPGHTATRRILSMKNSNDPIGNQTYDHPAHSAVPQPTVPTHTPDSISRVAVKETTAEQVISDHWLSMVLSVEIFLLP